MQSNTSNKQLILILVAAVSLLLAFIFPATLIIGFCIVLYMAFRYLGSKRLFYCLLATLLIGMAAYLASVGAQNRTDCGVRYAPETGCLTAMPTWIVLLGIAALISSYVLSIVIVSMAYKNQPQIKKTQRPNNTKSQK